MKRLLLITLVLTLCPFLEAPAQHQTSSQILSGRVQEAWVARHNESGSSNEYAQAMTVDAAGNIYVTGYSDSLGKPRDYLTVKYDAAGARQWTARYNGPGNGDDNARALAVDGTGNVYVTGGSWNGTNTDYATVKYNSAGTQEWVKTYNRLGNRNDDAVALAVDGTGNVYVTGYSYGSVTPADYVTVKYNSAGIRKWVATYNGPGNYYDLPVALAVDGVGNIYVTGFSFGLGTSADYATVKYNSAGVQEWVQTYNGPGNGYDAATALAVDSAGNVYVTGYSDAGRGNADCTGGNSDYATVKYNSTGQKQWVTRNDGPDKCDDRARALVVDSAGNVYVTGTFQWHYYSDSEDVEDDDYATIKYDSDGEKQWSAIYPGSGHLWKDAANALAVDGDGNVYVTGNNGGDYATIKYNLTGQEQWVARYNGPGNDWDGASSLVVDDARNVYVAGSSVGSGTGYDFVTIKYIQLPIADAGPDKKICAGGSIKIGGSPTGSGGHGGPYVFSWSPTTGLNDPTASNPIASPATITTYTVTVTETATDLSATDDVTVTVLATGWSVAHIVDVDDVIFGINQNVTTSAAPQNNRGLALSPDERFLYLGYTLNKYLVRKIDLSVADPADNHSAVVAQLLLPSGSQPARDIATDDRGRVYLALGNKIEVYNANLQAPPLHTISGFTACEGVTTRRENGMLVVYATDRLDKTLERFVLVEGAGEAITSSRKAGLDGDGEVRIVGASSPGGLDIGKYGSAWIADIGTGRVYRVSAAGRTVDSTVVDRAMDVAIDTTRGEVYVSQYTLRTLKVLNLSTGKIRRTLTPPAADLKVDLDGETGWGALCGIDVASCRRVFVANEKGRSILSAGVDSPFSNVGDDNDIKAADTDPVLVMTGNGMAKESEVEESEVASDQLTVISYQLEQNYPNPFNPSTKISFALPEATEVSLKIYDIAGQLVQTLVDGVVEAGRHQVVWDGTNQHGVNVASGVYFYQMRAGEFKQVRKMSLMK